MMAAARCLGWMGLVALGGLALTEVFRGEAEGTLANLWLGGALVFFGARGLLNEVRGAWRRWAALRVLVTVVLGLGCLVVGLLVVLGVVVGWEEDGGWGDLVGATLFAGLGAFGAYLLVRARRSRRPRWQRQEATRQGGGAQPQST